MKLTRKLSIVLAALLFANSSMQAQQNIDSQMPRWFVGAGVFGGVQTSSIDQTNWSAAYLNGINANIADLHKDKGNNLGFNISLGYFLGKNRNFGIGTGLQYLQLNNTFNVHHMAIEYQSKDVFGNVFRQGLRSNGAIEEQIKQNVIGLPIMLMFKKQLNQKWGVNMDGGVVINLINNAKFSVNKANFDYEAIYAFDGNGNPVYDNNPTPNPDNWLITKAHYEKVNTDGNVNAYFENLYAQGYNVGLGVNANNTNGELSNTSVSTSWFIRPSVSYRIKPNLALHANIMYQQINTSFASINDYRITDKRGSYASVSNGITTHSQGLIQFGIGIRYYFGKERVAEPKPAPKVEEPKKEDPYKEMVKVTVKLIDEKYSNGIAGNIIIKAGSKEVFNGNSDKSGLSNFYLEPGNYTVYVSAKGYIPVEESLSLSAKEKGTSKIIELKQPKIEKGLVFKLKAINFETGSNQLTQSSFDILNRMAAILLEYPQMVVEVGGHTDNVGDDQKNLILSENRAKSVTDYLMSRGVKASQLKAVGYGETKPVADNESEDGRRLNRRVMFTVLEF